VPILLVLLN